ncbi:MAG: hypothetical protein Q8N05_01455 [Bacteroidota bacterium]|nr:hypothetical protein [Bacteroidota bacterium]
MKKQLFKSVFFAFISASIISVSSAQGTGKNNAVVFGDSIYLKNVHAQPGEDTWKFVEDLKSPMWTKHDWDKAVPGPQQADLSAGVKLQVGFTDAKGRLETAYEDLRLFLAAGNVSFDNGKYVLETVEDEELKGESFRLEVQPGSCRIIAGDIEGVRRGIFYLEDEMLRQRGPFLPLGKVEKHPVIERRISRCFFGPIKRAPKMRDELMDDVNYYPEQYLNRLAHEGVNGLWLTIEFRDLVATSFTPEAGTNAEKRLAKLRQTVEACLRYGIRTYIFCIEPRAWDADSPVLKNYPELVGAKRWAQQFFCPMSQTAHQYLYESVNKIFKSVPDLGGMINISHGERGTTCLSAVSSNEDYKDRIDCPRCSHKEPWEILHASLSAMEQGMHDAAPDAELISWLYMPQPQRFVTGDSYSLGDWVYELPAHTPKGVILQFNFESGVSRIEFGKLLVGGDYWISNPGPSLRFSRIAEVARKNGTKVSAKIQTGNSHEVASTPFVPVPSLLYRKFDEMRKLGVSHTMLCWYFGNYPGLMNKAAGLLSMEPFPEDEDSFLHQLASINWKKEDVSKVVGAWKHFSNGYENYPLTNMFQYYGPMHDGPVWPLLLKPADAPLSPTWQIGSSTTLKPWPPSGDRIGECIGEILTLKEVVELARRMTTSWKKGMTVLTGLKKNYLNEPERILDIGVARALGIQFRSGYNILHFYLLREKMFRSEGRERLKILKQLADIIREEIELDKQLIVLCENDSRLGFHSEAEGYKYFPEKIRWRMEQLKIVLANDVPEVKKMIQNDQLLFPAYTGKKPEGPVADCIASDGSIWSGTGLVLPGDLQWQPCSYGSDKTAVQWASAYDKEALYILVSDRVTADPVSKEPLITSIQVKIEPQRLWPCKRFSFNAKAEKLDNKVTRVVNEQGIWYVAVRIPLKDIGLEAEHLSPIRLDVRAGNNAWRPNNPTTSRLMLGSDNPADLGWLVFHN